MKTDTIDEDFNPEEAEHIRAIREYGPCPAHRKSFLGFLEKEKKE